MVMASLISTSASLCSTSTSTKSALYPLSSSSLIPYHKAPKFGLSTWIPQLGLGPFSQWNGLKHLGISISPKFLNKERKGGCKGKVIHASLFGVGAPEALVIGVVALLVFGPKGLAEVARNLGKTLRAFQPTIKELQEVSREFKSTLEREIGLDEINQTQNTYSSKIRNTASTPSSDGSTGDSPAVADPNGAPSPDRAYTSEDYLKITEEQLKASAAEQQGQPHPPIESQLEPQTETQPQDGAPSPNRAYTSEDYLKITEEQLKASAAEQQGQSHPPIESQLEPQTETQPQASVKETAGAMPPPEKLENGVQNS